jgi:hypothetical protein
MSLFFLEGARVTGLVFAFVSYFDGNKDILEVWFIMGTLLKTAQKIH